MRTRTMAPMLAGALIAMTSLLACQKDEIAPLDTAPVEEEVNPKNLGFMYRGSMTGSAPWGSISKQEWNMSGDCVIGQNFSNSNPVIAADANVTTGPPSFVRGTSAGMLGFRYFQRGNEIGTPGSWGPWYILTPNFGPPLSIRKRLLMRIKHVPLVGGFTYNMGITYNGTTNTWNYAAAAASGKFEFQEITRSLLEACPVRD
ncbi:MAG TPA: hypothetical protein PLR96_10140 [Flavobacteriales bacterium]|nr:hypothetical protein [Flavobacteriales bacterium]